MDENQKGFLIWAKDHRKQLVLAGISVAAIVGSILGLKNKEAIVELWDTLEDNIKKASVKNAVTAPVSQVANPVIETVQVSRANTPAQIPFDVSQHIRTMSIGRLHSAEKAAASAALGITLLPHQTLVNTYTKCAA